MTENTPPRWATLQEAADYKRISTKTVRRYIDQGILDAQRLGPRLIRVDLNSFDRLGIPVVITAEAE